MRDGVFSKAKPARIRVIALCIFRRGERILVFEGYDSHTGARFYRPLGGGVEPGETTREAVVREIAEELGLHAVDLQFLGILENLFTLEGKAKHEIVFVYDGRFADETVYGREALHGREANNAPIRAEWRELNSFDEEGRLVPEGLRELLRGEEMGPDAR